MFAKDKYTFIFIPDVTGEFKRISVSKIVVKGILLVGLVSIFGFGYFSNYILDKSQGLEELKSLQGVSSTHKKEFQKFTQKLKQLEAQLIRLEQFDKKLRVITALESQPEKDKDFGSGGPEKDTMVNFSSASRQYTQSLIDSLNQEVDLMNERAENQEISFFELDEFFKEQSSLLSHTPSIWPARGWVTSAFGYRKSPFTGLREMHEGLDVATQMNSPILAPANGVVIRVGYHGGYGKMVEVDHGYGVVTRYGHCSKSLVEVGQRVKRGEKVALVGNTGRSTGPHLHYEVLLNGVPVNPYRYILEE